MYCCLIFQAAHGLESLPKKSALQQLEFKELRQWREERRAALVSQTRVVEHEDRKDMKRHYQMQCQMRFLQGLVVLKGRPLHQQDAN